jgi:hypothetical protein
VRAPRAGLLVRPLVERAPELPIDVVWPAGAPSPAAAQFIAVARSLAIR